MPLVLDASSHCDICTDSYSPQSFDSTPHVINCGHIFCRKCIIATEPANCPFCRESFDPYRAKKLHVERASQSKSPSSPSDVTKDELSGDGQDEPSDANHDLDELCDDANQDELVLLRRLAMAWDKSEEHQEKVLQDAAVWITRDNVATEPVRNAYHALIAHHELKEEIHRREMTMKELKGALNEIQENEELESFEKDTRKAIEESLLMEVKTKDATIAEQKNLIAELQILIADMGEDLYDSQALPRQSSSLRVRMAQLC